MNSADHWPRPANAEWHSPAGCRELSPPGWGLVAGLLAAAALLASCGEPEPEPPTPAKKLTVVQVDSQTSPPLQLAVQACAGLSNRKQGGSVYVQSDAHDQAWLQELALKPTATASATEFLKTCRAAFPSCVRYNYQTHQQILPSLLTAAAVLEAVPLDDTLAAGCAKVALDATPTFLDKNTPYLATQYVFEQYGKKTTGLAMLNPGYEQAPKDPGKAKIAGPMRPALVDLVFSRKLFALFLVNGCIDGNPEKQLLSSIVNAGLWPTPVAVYGYNNSWLVAGGYLYEAQTRCLDSRNMGAIASEAPNLSFFSTRQPAIAAPGVVQQNPLETATYDPTKTYVAFVVGDGDNIQFMLTARREWFRQRLTACAAANALCPPLTWTISPHLANLAPDLLTWYYQKSHETKRDYFALPPSGHLYAYPSSLAEPEQNTFAAATQNDARILGVAGVVHWDWAGTWNDAEDHFLPKYATAAGAIRGIFPVNVPYLFPAFPWWPEERFYRVLKGQDGGKVALFRPRQWRGVQDDSDLFFQSPAKMAAELGGYPKGTVTWVYMTSDGGLTLENSFAALTKLLPPHVVLVSTDTAAAMALAAGEKEGP